jgi:hypothetical protein
MNREVARDEQVMDIDVKPRPEKGRPQNARPFDEGEQDWLSMLIGAMEQASRAECRARPCDPPVLARLRAQLARPVSSLRPNDSSPEAGE